MGVALSISGALFLDDFSGGACMVLIDLDHMISVCSSKTRWQPVWDGVSDREVLDFSVTIKLANRSLRDITSTAEWIPDN